MGTRATPKIPWYLYEVSLIRFMDVSHHSPLTLLDYMGRCISRGTYRRSRRKVLSRGDEYSCKIVC